MKIKVGLTGFGVMKDYLAHRRHLPVATPHSGNQKKLASEIVLPKEESRRDNQQNSHKKDQKPFQARRKGLDILA